MLDENEFLSPFGVRGLSRVHRDHPYTLNMDGHNVTVGYVPGDSDTGMFGGNSNWRGPVWFPVNFLIIESLQKFHHYYGDDFKIEFPVGSGQAGHGAGRRGRDHAAADAAVPARRERPPAVLRDVREAADATRTSRTTCCSTSSSTATHGGGLGREPPDGLDGAGGEAA